MSVGESMSNFVVLLRGINVGGKNRLPMKELITLLESNGFDNVKTYIQSGNLVLASPENPETKIQSLIESEFGFSVDVSAVSASDFDNLVTKNPYAQEQGNLVHYYFCRTAPKIDSARVMKYLDASEQYTLEGNLFYLYAPNGIGRSKLVANIEQCLGVSATGRNMNTVNKLVTMLASG